MKNALQLAFVIFFFGPLTLTLTTARSECMKRFEADWKTCTDLVAFGKETPKIREMRAQEARKRQAQHQEP